VEAPPYRGGVCLGDAEEGQLHGGGVNQWAERVALLDTPLDP